MKQIWKAVPEEGYSDLYEISNNGIVRTKSTKKPRKSYPTKNKNNGKGGGYHQVVLFNKGKIKGLYISRLVAKAFLIKEEEMHKEFWIKYKDGNISNNKVDNLSVEYRDPRMAYPKEIVDSIRKSYSETNDRISTISRNNNVDYDSCSKICHNEISRDINYNPAPHFNRRKDIIELNKLELQKKDNLKKIKFEVKAKEMEERGVEIETETEIVNKIRQHYIDTNDSIAKISVLFMSSHSRIKGICYNETVRYNDKNYDPIPHYNRRRMLVEERRVPLKKKSLHKTETTGLTDLEKDVLINLLLGKMKK